MRFIHAADLHIDSPMVGPTRRAGTPVDRLAGATRAAFENLVRAALDMGVELVVFAGDAVDGHWHDMNTGLYLQRQVRRLTDAGVQVVVATGNHDAESVVVTSLQMPDGVHVLPTDRAATVGPDELGLPVAVHGRGHSARTSPADALASCPPPVPGVVNIGVLHTALADGPGPHGDGRVTAEDLRPLGYDYWALGHSHRREVVGTAPWIVSPGNLQGRKASETGPKGFTLVTVESGQIVEVAEAHADVVRWQVAEVDLTDATLPGEVTERMRAGLGALATGASGRLVAARVELVGTTTLHHHLRDDPRRLDTEARTIAAAVGDLWVERVLVRTNPPVDRTSLEIRRDAVGDLFEEISRLQDDPDAAAKRFADLLAPLRAVLPPGVGDPTDEAALVRALGDAESHLAVLLDGSDPATGRTAAGGRTTRRALRGDSATGPAG